LQILKNLSINGGVSSSAFGCGAAKAAYRNINRGGKKVTQSAARQRQIEAQRPKAAKTREGPVDLRSAQQVSISEPARRESIVELWTTMAAKTREGPVDLRSAQQVSEKRTGPKGSICRSRSKLFVIFLPPRLIIK